MEIKNQVRLFVAAVCLAGFACLAWGAFHWETNEPLLLIAYVCLVAVASALKVVLPGFEATASVSFVFFLMSVCTLSLSETLLLGVTAAIVQCYWNKSKNLRFVHFAFNLSQVSIALAATSYAYKLVMRGAPAVRMPLAMLAACVVYYVFNTVPVAGVVSLTERKPFRLKWRESYAWVFASYLIGAAIAGIVLVINRRLGWELSVLVMPAVYALYRTYAVHLEKLEEHGKHLQEIADLNLRTVETLALAIEAKDHTTGDHLQRVQVYALEMGKDLGLSTSELDALRAASVLHDIGKLAVPEHIIAKPGRLTPEEFDKMKIHPIVGAEILEQVRFPYAVVPIVRSHHEKWDGSGYPDGLKGDEIPIGARILATVDCLDALASDRQYRKALPLDEAMACVEKESGKSFDPKIVAALKARYVELEEFVKKEKPQVRPKLSIDLKITRGGAPGAGFAVSSAPANLSEARRSALPVSGTRSERLSVLAMRLHELVRYDAIAIFQQESSTLRPMFVMGEQMTDLEQLSISAGSGLVGWVASTGEAIVNGNPQVEEGFEKRSGGLSSALAMRLEENGEKVGVLAIYSTHPDGFHVADLKRVKPFLAEIAFTLRMGDGRGASGSMEAAERSAPRLRPLLQ